MRKLTALGWGSAMVGSAVAQSVGVFFAGAGVVIGFVEDRAVWNWVITGLGFQAVGIGWLLVANMTTLMNKVSRIEDKVDDLRKVI